MRIGEMIAASRDWFDLPRDVRHEVKAKARDGAAHPDPAVAATVARWGRASWLRHRLYLLAVAVIGVSAGTATGLSRRSRLVEDHPAAVQAFAVAIIVASVGAYLAATRWPSYAGAINLLELAKREPQGRLPIRVVATAPPRWLVVSCAVLGVIGIGYAYARAGVLDMPVGDRLQIMLLSLPCLAVMILMSWTSLRLSIPVWRRSRPWAGRELLIATKRGVEFPHLRLRLRWADIRTVALAPTSRLNTDPIGISFHLRANRAVLDRVSNPTDGSPRPTSAARRMVRDGRVQLPLHWLDAEPVQLLATLRAMTSAAESTTGSPMPT